ncbi:MAG: hypothetical protein ACOZFS_09920 [Thermodesulfobacteriota bacterium]
MMFVKDLLKFLKPGTKQKIAEYYQRHNLAIRKAIRDELRLNLAARGMEGEESESRVHVEVDKVGLPQMVANIPIEDKDWLSAILTVYRPYLSMLAESTAQVAELLFRPELKELPEVMTLGRSVPEAHQLAQALLQRIKLLDLVERILAFNEDVLGAYQYDLNERAPSKILLFWGVIGLVSQGQKLDLETLTALVLAHEMAHAYTHLGYDIDRKRWPSRAFAESDREVKEGLAQYYAARVMERLKDRLPLGPDTFAQLLAKQSTPYHAHEPWMQEYTPEVVRAALISGRGKNPLFIDPFNDELADLAPRLKRRPKGK